MTIENIKNQILAEKLNQEALNGIDSSSNASIFRICAYVVATAIWTLYQFFNVFKDEIDYKIKTQKNYSELWFRDKALAYRHGVSLPENSDEYPEGGDDNSVFVVKRSAVKELELSNRKFLFIKVATEVGGVLAPLNDLEIAGLQQYFARIKPAGTKIIVFTGPADDLKLNIRFYYDPLLLDSNGARIDGTDNEPVQNTIREYLKNLKFNGEFTLAALEDLLQSVDGCADREAYVDNAEANYLNPPSFQTITSSYVANSGYMEVTDENLNIDFIAKTVQL
jgi:hypothetical protein